MKIAWLLTALCLPLLAFAADIRVDADFPGGNISVQRIESNTVFVAPDLRDTSGWWFYWNFRLRAPAEQPVTIVFTEKNPIGVRGPAMSLDSGMTWQWLGTNIVHHFQHNDKPAWSFVARVPAGQTEVRYAFTPQYLESHLHAWLDQHKNNPALRVEQLCRSRQGRPVELVHVGTGGNVVLLTSRHHCCETMANYALEGFLDVALTSRWEVIAVPFMDKDGCESGDQGKNRRPYDHNRDYNDQPLYPEVAALMKLGAALTNCVVATFDLHCPAIRGEWNDRVYFVGAAAASFWQKEQAFARVLARVQRGPIKFREQDCLKFGTAWNTADNFRQGRSSAAWAHATFPEARLVAGMEIAYADALGVEVNAANARAFGRDLARALAEYLAINKQ